MTMSRAMAAGFLATTLWAAPLAAQDGGPGSDGASATPAARAWFARHMGFASGKAVSQADVGLLAGLWAEATDPARPVETRRGAFRRLLDEMVRVQGVPAWRYSGPALDGLAARVEDVAGLAAPPAVVPSNGGQPAVGRVRRMGTGPTPLVLVGDLDYDGSVYEEFQAATRDRFTTVAVTLPGTGGTAPPPFPERGPYSATPWLDHAERLILDVIEREGLDRPAVVGIGRLAPFVARMAVRHPETFRAAVVLHGLVFQPVGSVVTPGSIVTPSEMRQMVDATLPPLFPATPDSAVRAAYRGAALRFARDSARALELAEVAGVADSRVVTHYNNEVRTIDLRPVLADLRIPMLAIPSTHDGASPLAATTMFAGQWYAAQLDHPDVPLTVVPFPDTRSLAPVERPVELGRAVADFLDGRPVVAPAPSPRHLTYTVSPRATASAVVGATEVTVEYHSPAARGRELWGGLVPYDAVWRAGANDATTIRFSRDVEIEGQPLGAGQYTFFVTPRESEPWTLAFNRVPVQFGSFFYRPEHDALRVEVEPEEAPHQEHLRYRIEPVQPVEARLEMHWGDKRVTANLLAREGTGMTRIAATAPGEVEGRAWTELATDPGGDGTFTWTADATALAYSHDRSAGIVWFRIGLQNAPDPYATGVNLVVDTDRDQGTGSPWWGGTSGFTFDRVATLWVTRSGDAYWGTIGTSGHADALAQRYDALTTGTLDLAIDGDRNLLYVGIPAADLDDDGAMRLLVAVGSNMLWNDNVPGEEGVALELR